MIKLHLNQPYDTLSLLEPMWVLAALLTFSAGPTQGLYVAIGLVWVAIPFAQRWLLTGQPAQSTAFDIPWALLLIGALVSQMASHDANLGLPVLLTLTGCLGLYYVAANARRPLALAQLAVLAGTVVAGYFLIQYRYIPHTDKSGLASVVGMAISGLLPRFGGWEPFSNGVATLLEGLLPLSLALLVAHRSRGWRAINGAIAGTLALAILTTASRGAWVALLAAGLLWLASRRKAGFIALLALTCAGIAALASYLLWAESATVQNIPMAGPVLYQLFARPDRLEVYQGSLRLIQDFPITGIGMGDVFGLVYSRYVLLIPHVFLTYAHNLYLTVWLGHGIAGIVGMGWLVVALGTLAIRERQHGAPAPLFQAAWVGAAAILIHGLFDARQYVDLWSMWPLFFLLGLAVATALIEPLKAHPRPGVRSWRWAALALLVVAGALLWRPAAASVFANLGAMRQAQSELAQEEEDTRLQAAIAHYRRALELDAANRTANLRLGNLAVAAGQYEEGAARLQVVWQAAPQDPTARKALGLAYAWVGRIDEAAELLAGTKDIVAELNTWGNWHRSEGRPQVAAYAYQTSLALEPDQPQLIDLLNSLEVTENGD